MEGSAAYADHPAAQAIAAIPPDPPKPVTHDVERKIKRCEASSRYRAKNRAAYLSNHRSEMQEWRVRNPEKSRELAKAYRARNPDQVRSSNLKKNYGITLDQFNELFKSQGSACAICKGSSSKGKNWHVDHCHKNENIRGILCQNCNLMIGHAEDRSETLLAAVEYLGRCEQ